MAVLADLAIKATALLTVAVICVGLMRRASAASRHLAWTAVFLAAALLPVARVALPSMTLFVLPAPAAPALESPAVNSTAPAPDPAASSEPSAVTDAPGQPESALQDDGASGLQARGNPGSDPGLHSGASPTPKAIQAPRRPWTLSGVLVFVWAAGAIAILLKGVVGAIRARQLARHAHPATDARLLARIEQTAKAYRVSRPLKVLISSSEWMPATWGIARPTILLPASATSWIDEHPPRLDAVLVHEMAHVARVDALSQIIARLAVALFWFNPLVWLAARRARLERERACDDAVLARGLRPSAYAGDLLVLAQSLAPPALTSSAELAMARRSQLDDRIRALLDDRVNRRGVSQVSLVIATALVILMLPLAAARLAARTNTDASAGLVASDDNLPVTSAAVPAAAAMSPDGAVALSVQTPQATPTPSPQATPSPYAGVQLLDQPGKWRLERGDMARQLLRQAQSYVHDAEIRVEIGTLAPVDTKGAFETLDAVEQATASPSLRHGEPPFVLTSVPTDAEIATIRNRFAEASKKLEAALTRFGAGLATTADVDAAFKTAIAALTDPPAPPRPPGRAPRGAEHVPVRFVARSGANTMDHHYDYFASMTPSSDPWKWKPGPLSDADLIAALKNLATMTDDTKRAEMLLALAESNSFTPEMVALYVAAASGITSDAERARVFARPIRLKSGGGAPFYITPPEDTRTDASARKLYELLTQRQSVEDEFLKGTVPTNTPGLTTPVAREHPLPKYTPAAMRQKIQGDVLVDVVVGTDGKVLRARIAQSLDSVYGLDEEALNTAAQWTFDPGVLNGQNVPVVARLTLTFRLH